MPTIELTYCRVCESQLVSCLDLGEQYLSSIFPEDIDYRDYLDRYPLVLKLCSVCGLLQLGHEIDLTKMYENYPYISSSNDAMKKALYEVAEDCLSLSAISPGDIILDIGCNDGTLLSCFNGKGYKLVGVDPAKNVTPPSDIEFIRGFFRKEMLPKKAKLIFSIAMFYHLTDPVAFCKDVRDSMTDDGLWVIQMAYLGDMVKYRIYDNIVHEHNCYYSLETLSYVLDQADLVVSDVSFNNIYGGSFRVLVEKKPAKQSWKIESVLDYEKNQELTNLSTYREFDRKIHESKEKLVALLHKFNYYDKKVWVYGASTKGNTILQYCGIDFKLIEAAADSNPYKHGRFMIGSDIKIRSEEAMRKAKPDYLLSLPYGFTRDFIKKEDSLISTGTKFISPLPEVSVLP